MPRRSADQIIASARLPPESAPRVSFEIQRLDAYAACNGLRARLEADIRVKAGVNADGSISGAAASVSGPSALTLGSIVIGGAGLAGGIITTVLAAGLEAPPLPDPNAPSAPNVDAPEVEGKTGVIVAGVLTGVVVVGAVVATLLLAPGGDDDDDDGKKRKLPDMGGGIGIGGGGVGGGQIPPINGSADIIARIRGFEAECPVDPPDAQLTVCNDKARALRLACSSQ
jgi:hypothetical protein